MKKVHIREVKPGPTPERRLFHIYVGTEMFDWLAFDLSADCWKETLEMALNEARK